MTSTADFYICGNNIQMVLRNPVWQYGNSTECTNLRRKVQTTWIQPEFGKKRALDIYNSIHRTVVNQLQSTFGTFLQEHNGAALYPCTSFGDSPCQGINGNGIISLTVTDCITLCQIGTGGNGLPLLAPVKCGDACCKRENRICFDQFTQELCISESVITLISDCVAVPTNCETPTSECSAPCDRL